MTTDLNEKLDRRLPGAFCVFDTTAAPEHKWQVVQMEGRSKSGLKVLGTGASQREAIDRAVFLFGVQR